SNHPTIARTVIWNSWRAGCAFQSARSAGAWPIWRIPVRVGGFGAEFATGNSEFREYAGRPRECREGFDRIVHQLYGERSAISGAHRSRESQEHAGAVQPDYRRVAGLYGLG